jgi:hypothetical protein
MTTEPRVFRVDFSESNGEGKLRCPFCNDEFRLPFGIQVVGRTTEPSGPEIIREHYDPGVADNTEVIDRCANWNSWTSSPWEVRESDSNRPFATGKVEVAKDGTLQVRTDSTR